MKNNQSVTHRFNQSFRATLLTFLLAIASSDVFAAPGDLDPSWGNGGGAVASFSDAIDYTTSTVVQPDGKVLVGGYTYTFAGGSQRFVSSFRGRYNQDGTLDATFGTGGKIIDAAGSGEYFGWGLALQPDGKIVAVGTKGVIYSTTNAVIAVVRYNADGSLDTSFGEGGKVFKILSDYGDHANDVIVQPDGKIVVAGFSGLGAPTTRAVVLRFNTDETLDQSFGWYGVFSTDFGSGGFNQAGYAALQPDGKLIFACDAYNGADSDFGVIRLNANGILDSGFGANGKVMTSIASESIWGMALQPDKKILVSGENYDANFNLVSTSIVRYDGDGTLDTGFGSNGIVTTPTSSTYKLGCGLAVQPNGKIVTAGNKLYNSPNLSIAGERRQINLKVPAQMRENPEITRPSIAVARYNADGSADTNFGADGKISRQPIPSVTARAFAHCRTAKFSFRVFPVRPARTSIQPLSVIWAIRRLNAPRRAISMARVGRIST